MTELPDRKSARLKKYDYSTPGAYFVTICTKDRKNLFGGIQNGQILLSGLGKFVDEKIRKIEFHYNNVKIDKYVIMPNHIHMIIMILKTERINPFPTMEYSISDIVGRFKAGVTRNVGDAFMHPEKTTIWQRSFHDHIIRDKEDYLQIWNYIDTNVLKWETDCFYNK